MNSKKSHHNIVVWPGLWLRYHAVTPLQGLWSFSRVAVELCLAGVTLWLLCHASVEAAVSKGSKQQLDIAVANQGGGTLTSLRFRQQSSIGESVASNRITSSRFQILPGFLGAGAASPTSPPVSELDLKVLHAFTEPGGIEITPAVWQQDRDPFFVWEPPEGPDVAGYSYAIDGAPDAIPETTSTSFNVATSTLQSLTDGKHTFSVAAVNTAGNMGRPISFEIWIDTTPPQVVSYSPAPSALLNTLNPPFQIATTDAGSGVASAGVQVTVNGQLVTTQLNQATGIVTITGGLPWREGPNSVALDLKDLVGNAINKLIWSFTLDVTPPSGTVTIDAGALETTSAYVTLSLTAEDHVSGVERMLISNEESAGYIEEPFAAVRPLWMLTPMRGSRTVYVKFIDKAGNVSAPVHDDIFLNLRAPETMITSGPFGYSPDRTAIFEFACPEGDCVFSYAVDNGDWSPWSPTTSVTLADLAFGNHYFRVKAAKDTNGTPGIQPDEEDPSPAERTWIVGVEPPMLSIPKGPPIKLWRLE